AAARRDAHPVAVDRLDLAPRARLDDAHPVLRDVVTAVAHADQRGAVDVARAARDARAVGVAHVRAAHAVARRRARALAPRVVRRARALGRALQLGCARAGGGKQAGAGVGGRDAAHRTRARAAA